MYPIVDLVEHQVIAAVEEEEGVEEALHSQCNVVFLLCGTIFSVKAIVDRLKQAGKHVFLHMEFIEGIAPDRSGVAYVHSMFSRAGLFRPKARSSELRRK